MDLPAHIANELGLAAIIGKGSLARKGTAGQGENGLDIGGAVEFVEVDDHLLGVGPVEGMGHIGHADKLAGDPKESCASCVRGRRRRRYPSGIRSGNAACCGNWPAPNTRE